MSATDNNPEQRLGGIIFWIALAFSSFQLWTAAFSPLSSQVVRAIHVGFVLLLVFALRPGFRSQGSGQPALAWVLGLTGFAFGFYHWYFEADLTLRAGELTTTDWVIGVVTIALVFEAARRMMGWGLPLICGMFLAYALFGQYLPGALAHRGFGAAIGLFEGDFEIEA